MQFFYFIRIRALDDRQSMSIRLQHFQPTRNSHPNQSALQQKWILSFVAYQGVFADCCTPGDFVALRELLEKAVWFV